MDSHKNPNLQTTAAHHHHPVIPSSSQDFKKNPAQIHHTRPVFIKNVKELSGDRELITAAREGENGKTPPLTVEESGRERLKRHRVEMAGRVWIPDRWGHEEQLKEWRDCSVFDSCLGNNNIIMSARAALIQQAKPLTFN